MKVNGDETVEADEAIENPEEEVVDDVAEIVDDVTDDVTEVNSVKEILEDVMDVVSAVAAVDGHPEEVDVNANLELDDQTGSGNDGAEVTIKIVKTGQIMIEETDLGNDECIRTEYEIEEVEIGE